MQNDNCRFCRKRLSEVLNLGAHPFPNALLSTAFDSQSNFMLILSYCDSCGLYQIPHYENDVFGFSYPYFSSQSQAFLDQQISDVSFLKESYGLPLDAQILEVGCNDGYLLHAFRAQGFKNLVGVEPSGSVLSKVHSDITTFNEFWSLKFAKELGRKFDCIIAKNVAAHVPDLQNFMSAFEYSLKSDGILIIEVHDFQKLVSKLQYDSIYHEHYSYFTRNSLTEIGRQSGFQAMGFQDTPFQGGSIKGFFRKASNGDSLPNHQVPLDLSVFRMRMDNSLGECRRQIKKWHCDGEKIVAYGAAAKACQFFSLLDYESRYISYCVDDTPMKQGKFMPGSRIGIVGQEHLRNDNPSRVLISAWNVANEIKKKVGNVRAMVRRELSFECVT